MTRRAPASVRGPEAPVVLSRALLRAAATLGLNGQTMARVVGVSGIRMTRPFLGETYRLIWNVSARERH